MSGYKRKVDHPVTQTLKDIYLPALDARLAELKMLSLNTAYAKQKSSLKSELHPFCILCLLISRFIQQLP